MLCISIMLATSVKDIPVKEKETGRMIFLEVDIRLRL